MFIIRITITITDAIIISIIAVTVALHHYTIVNLRYCYHYDIIVNTVYCYATLSIHYAITMY